MNELIDSVVEFQNLLEKEGIQAIEALADSTLIQEFRNLRR